MENTRKKEPEELKGLSGTLYTVMHDVAVILAVITVCFVFFARLVGVNGSSMYPTLVGQNEANGASGDYLVLESNVIHPQYERGDIVVACVPTFDSGKPIVKRVIAVGGETVELRRDETDPLEETICVYVDGVKLDEPYIREPMRETPIAGAGFTFKVPENCYFLMGDNRNNSTDSRYASVGAVDYRYIVGKALIVAFPGQDAMDGNRRTWSRFGAVYE